MNVSGKRKQELVENDFKKWKKLEKEKDDEQRERQRQRINHKGRDKEMESEAGGRGSSASLSRVRMQPWLAVEMMLQCSGGGAVGQVAARQHTPQIISDLLGHQGILQRILCRIVQEWWPCDILPGVGLVGSLQPRISVCLIPDLFGVQPIYNKWSCQWLCLGKCRVKRAVLSFMLKMELWKHLNLLPYNKPKYQLWLAP